MMSEENVEIVRTICDAYARGDYEASLGGLDEEIDFSGPPDITGGGVWHGREEISERMTRFLGTWAAYHYEVRNLIDGGEEVLVEAWQRGRGRTSGVEVSERIYSVFTVRGGRVIRQRMFRERDKALEAAGLAE